MNFKEKLFLGTGIAVLLINTGFMVNINNKLGQDESKELSVKEKLRKELDIVLVKIRRADSGINVLVFEELVADGTSNGAEGELMYKKLALHKEYNKISDAYIKLAEDNDLNTILNDLEKTK